MLRISRHLFQTVAASLAIVALSGCMAEVLTVTAIQGELAAQNAKSATSSLEYAKEQTGATTLRKAIDTYQGETGAYPPSLDALVPNYLGQLPKTAEGGDYFYNADTGQFSTTPFPADLVPEADKEMKKLIEEAVAAYTSRTGYYPPSLQALVKARQLNYVPQTSNGQAYLYNPQTGQVTHPAETQAPTYGAANRGAGMGGSGAGPLGEVTTGIGIQNQLNSMSNSGVSAAGTRSREGVRGASGSYSDRQLQAIENLDL